MSKVPVRKPESTEPGVGKKFSDGSSPNSIEPGGSRWGKGDSGWTVEDGVTASIGSGR